MGVESRLKTAVQSQLDGVKTGIDQLRLALQNVLEVKKTMNSVEQMMNSAFQDQHIKEIKVLIYQLKKRIENHKHKHKYFICFLGHQCRTSSTWCCDGKSTTDFYSP